MALNLHSYYTAIERIFEDIARTIDENIPTGSDWHRSLLLQMSAEVDQKRQAVIRRETRYCLEEYRGFRHVVRNVYAFNFRPGRLKELVTGLPGCFEMVKTDLLEFIQLLESI